MTNKSFILLNCLVCNQMTNTTLLKNYDIDDINDIFPHMRTLLTFIPNYHMYNKSTIPQELYNDTQHIHININGLLLS